MGKCTMIGLLGPSNSALTLIGFSMICASDLKKGIV